MPVGFCELYQNPNDYVGKLIQVHAIVYGSKHLRIEDATYPSPHCNAYMTITLLIPKKQFAASSASRDSAFGKFKEGLKGENRIIAEMQGTFELGSGAGVHSMTTALAGQFILSRVDDVVLLPVPRK